MMQTSLPVLIIGYARKTTLLALIDTAAASEVKAIYISLDGPKNDSVELIQGDIKAILTEYQKMSPTPIRILSREKNLGAGAGVVAAVDWFFKFETEGIILEDDLVVDQTFFRYAGEALQKIETNSRILSISGTRLIPSTEHEASLTSYPLAWGWATTREKWLIMRSLIFKRSSPIWKHKSVQEGFFWNTGKRRALKSQIAAWDIPLAEGMASGGYFTLVPPVNLVSNVGFDTTATHTFASTWPMNLRRVEQYPEPLKLNFEDSKCQVNDEFMRSKIFMISHRNSLTGIISFLFDPLRFMKHRNNGSMQEKANIEESKSDA